MSQQNNTQSYNGGIPSYNSGSGFLPITTSVNTQVKTGPGVLQRLTINTGGTGSACALYDGQSSVVTISIATPAVIGWTAHGLAAGTAVKFTNAGGALPTGITANTTYYVSSAGLTANAFQIADTQAHAIAGTNSINTSGSQSGTQTAWNASLPIGTYSTTAQNSVQISAAVVNGIIAITTDGGAAANLTVLYN